MRAPRPFPAPPEVLNTVDKAYEHYFNFHSKPRPSPNGGRLLTTGCCLGQVAEVFNIAEFVGLEDRRRRAAMSRSDRVRQIEAGEGLFDELQ